MAPAKSTLAEVSAAVDAALATAKRYKPESDLEEHHTTFVVALLTDAKTRLGSIPGIVDTAAKADAVASAEAALDAARAAQQG